jgi:hypothetical protein
MERTSRIARRQFSKLLRTPLLLIVSAVFLSATILLAQENPPRKSEKRTRQTMGQQTSGLHRHDGFLPFYWDQRTGKLLLEVSHWDDDFLYVPSLSTGVGSISLRLDRAMIRMGSEAVAHFSRAGPRVFLVQVNTKFRALHTKNQALVRSVEESFPQSVLASFPITAEENGKVLIDATEFFLQDTFGIHQALQEGRQGDFRLDRSRSAIYFPHTKAFPRNIEVETILTFTSENPGPLVQQNTPDPRSLTLRTHHSFVALPDPGYQPREFDPRLGNSAVVFNDYARPFNEPLERRWITRWRLEKRDANAAVSPPKRPIVYYLDGGIPEPFRDAIRQGALWWNSAFEAAGFKQALEVRDLPDGADPMDIRYSVIEWIHRSEEGLANGPSLHDPRTGEIIKAAPRLHSDRTRTDSVYWSGLLRTANAGATEEFSVVDWELGNWVAALDPKITEEEFVLARLRVLAAHEVGHTLGLEHNFIASTYGRASVMDYPAPLVRLSDGKLDLSQAYRQEVGEYDHFVIRYAYSVFPQGEDPDALQAIVKDGIRKGMLFISSRDVALHPLANAWDNGPDPVESLRQALAVRSILLKTFGEQVLRDGQPVALLTERFLPVYLYHRFALDPAIKLIGGIKFTYAVKGDGQLPTELIAPDHQREAFHLLLEALQPGTLAIPRALLPLFPPRPFGYDLPVEAFEQISAAKTLAGMVVRALLDRERAARIVAFQDRQEAPFTFQELLEELIRATWNSPQPEVQDLATLRRVTQRAVVDGLIGLALDPEATPEVRGMAVTHLQGLGDLIAQRKSDDPVVQAHLGLAKRDIQQCLARAASPAGLPKVPQPPPANLTSEPDLPR